MDVVPVYADEWTHPPFAAEMDAEGRIFARGAQDMKSIGTQYLGAIRALKQNGIKLKRTVHVTFAPNEEIGGVPGWADFIHTAEFRALNIGFYLDESYASENDDFIVWGAERTLFTTIVDITGASGHGSFLSPNTVGHKVQYMINKMMDFRASQVMRLQLNPDLSPSDVTSINLTMMNSSVQCHTEQCFFGI